MFRIDHVAIAGFWKTHRAEVTLHPDVNIFIGRNGTGMTTFLSLLLAALKVDVQVLASNDFNTITVRLKEDARNRTIRVERLESAERPYDYLRYKVGTRSWT